MKATSQRRQRWITIGESLPLAELIPPLRLRAFEFRRRMTGGRSRPMLVACLDDAGAEHQVVLKLREVPVSDCSFGPASLACELVCAILARMAGLSVPDYAIVSVDDNEGFLRNIPDREAQRDLRRNLGENFGSTYLEGHAQYLPTLSMGVVGRSKLEDVLAFDAYVLNNDRKVPNPNLIIRGGEVVLIDHSLSFPHIASPGAAAPWNERFPDQSVREHCTYPHLKKTDPRFEAFVNFLNDELANDDCRAILDLVPDAWQRPNTQDKNSILRYLLRRSIPFIQEGIGHLTRVCE